MTSRGRFHQVNTAYGARELLDLRSVGPATVRDLALLGVSRVDDLIGLSATDLYESLCCITKTRHDPCVIDLFQAAIAQAENPCLEDEKCNWWFWSKIRKSSRR